MKLKKLYFFIFSHSFFPLVSHFFFLRFFFSFLSFFPFILCYVFCFFSLFLSFSRVFLSSIFFISFYFFLSFINHGIINKIYFIHIVFLLNKMIPKFKCQGSRQFFPIFTILNIYDLKFHEIHYNSYIRDNT